MVPQLDLTAATSEYCAARSNHKKGLKVLQSDMTARKDMSVGREIQPQEGLGDRSNCRKGLKVVQSDMTARKEMLMCRQIRPQEGFGDPPTAPDPDSDSAMSCARVEPSRAQVLSCARVADESESGSGVVNTSPEGFGGDAVRYHCTKRYAAGQSDTTARKDMPLGSRSNRKKGLEVVQSDITAWKDILVGRQIRPQEGPGGRSDRRKGSEVVQSDITARKDMPPGSQIRLHGKTCRWAVRYDCMESVIPMGSQICLQRTYTAARCAGKSDCWYHRVCRRWIRLLGLQPAYSKTGLQW
ncbi:hypothetical protein DFH07DRAFT_1017542 [Mycena maculata]|uniref:Uncharacterized protein n=1 Tax=Mycena maculata TaxID=230809 RepID=A0AAD7KCM7_9AGAR|nr:hypothetical protein DFH07DRAFT_1017542 [Mycena maculata]